MAKHNLGYFAKEGAINMFSHGFMSFVAVGVTVACLLIMGTFTLVAVNINGLLEELEQVNEILAYVDETYDKAQAKAVGKALEALPNVTSVQYISREEALETFVAQYPDEALFQDLDAQILRDRYSIKIDDLEQQSQTVREIAAVEGVARPCADASRTR